MQKEQKKPRSSGFTINISDLEKALSLDSDDEPEEETPFLRRKRLVSQNTSEDNLAFLEEMVNEVYLTMNFLLYDIKNTNL